METREGRILAEGGMVTENGWSNPFVRGDTRMYEVGAYVEHEEDYEHSLSFHRNGQDAMTELLEDRIECTCTDVYVYACTSDDPTNHQGDTCPIHEA